MKVNGRHYRTVWMCGSSVYAINQNALPFKFKIVKLRNHRETIAAIKDMTVRGAGAIGAAAGYAMAQAFLQAPASRVTSRASRAKFWVYAKRAKREIEKSRPTAQNLFYATNRVYAAARAAAGKAKSVEDVASIAKARRIAVREARAVADEDAAASRAIGVHGEKLVRNGARVATHCNAGWLAFVDWGTALAPVYAARAKGKRVFVFVDETGPRLQGARLTAWELRAAAVPHAIISDSAGAYFTSKGEIDLMLVGADRIAANGDAANKIGTLQRAIACAAYGVPFFVAAPTASFDLKCRNGVRIPIEERSGEEVLCKTGVDERGVMRTIRVANPSSKARNPAFDVTPARLITGIITEYGVIRKPNAAKIKAFFAKHRPKAK
ncbi:MAG: S-methyl-5-thioribose-1-phosphate isomerase [Candidatus Micrarchaeota archaeon]